MYFKVKPNSNIYYYQIGNWTAGDDSKNIQNLPKNKFVYKTKRVKGFFTL